MNGIDMNMIKSKKGRFISSEEALKDVKPIEWGEDVLAGKTKVVIMAEKRGTVEWNVK